MLTFAEYYEKHCPRDRAHSKYDLRVGWEAAMRELTVREWEFRVVRPATKDDPFGRSAWHVIPYLCIRPMVELFGNEIELRPVYVNRGVPVKGADMLARLNAPVAVPF